MSIKRLSIEGIRGYKEKTTFNFALPDHENPGSGLTVLVGSNNSGKSTIVESLYMLSNNTKIIPNSTRNEMSKNVKIEVETLDRQKYTLAIPENNGAFAYKSINGIKEEYWTQRLNMFILSARRNFASTFSNNSKIDRYNYYGNNNNDDYRTEQNLNHNFGGRLLNIIDNQKELFDSCLNKVLDPVPSWTIEAFDSNNLYLELQFDKIKHTSKGAGDGYINIFNIIDALYDSEEDNIIIIDEPEISLHPDLQRKLFDLLVEYSKDKQIIVTTHSPYFVNWKILSKYGKIIRLKKEEDKIEKYELTEKTKEGIEALLKDSHHPHILSLDTNEIFFLNDKVILTEGQEDVLGFKTLFKKYNFQTKASFFGWGAGGESKITAVLNILEDLGYKKVFIILDNDKKDMVDEYKIKYPNYMFYSTVADDIRDKKLNPKEKKLKKSIIEANIDEEIKKKILDCFDKAHPEKKGLLKHLGSEEINEEYENGILKLISEIKKYMNEEKVNNKEDNNIELSKNENEININLSKEEQKDYNQARKLLSAYLSEHDFFKWVQKKYDYLEFRGSSGEELSFKKIKPNLFYAISNYYQGLEKNYSITYEIHYIINVKKQTVKIKKRKIKENKLPKKY